MPLLPKPYPDEVVGSVIARACAQSGLPVKRLLQHALGNTRSCTSFLMASGTRRLAMLMGIDPEELVLKHTIFPYAVAFMPAPVQAKLLAKAVSLDVTEASVSSLTKNVSSGVPFKRVCKQCIREDLREYGETYWRRSHLLPAAVLCPVHGTLLSDTDLPLRGHAQERRFCLPREATLTKASPKGRYALQLGEQVSRLATLAVNGRVQPLENWHEVYRERARALGYVLPSGALASGLLARTVEQTFGSGLLTATACPLTSRPGNSWPALLSRAGSDVSIATAKHLFMNVFLDAEVRAPQDVKNEYKPPGKAPRDYAAVDCRTARTIVELLRKAVASGERLTVGWLLESAGASGTYKHHHAEMPKTREAIAAFRVSDQAERQVGMRATWRRRYPNRARAAAVFRERVTQLGATQTPDV